MTTRQTCQIQQLQQIIANHANSLRSAVAAEALAYGGEIDAFFRDVLRYGCASGMIGSLIYYRDTHAFYDRHYQEIEVLRCDLENSLGESLRPQGDLKNWYAWLAFEETASTMAGELYL